MLAGRCQTISGEEGTAIHVVVAIVKGQVFGRAADDVKPQISYTRTMIHYELAGPLQWCGRWPMAKPLVRGLKSVVLTSERPDVTAVFYRDVLNMPFVREEHPGAPTHWACQFGGLQFAIHHHESLGLSASSGDGGTFLTFTIDDLDTFLAHLDAMSVEVIDRRAIGPMRFVTFHDPDGRRVSCGTAWGASSGFH
jgi:catechol 2,3-dioxygenase-like lactoylglutathione lyase family enzyme